MKKNKIDKDSQSTEIKQEQTATERNKEKKKPGINDPDKINPDKIDPDRIEPDKNVPTREDKPPLIISKL